MFHKILQSKTSPAFLNTVMVYNGSPCPNPVIRPWGVLQYLGKVGRLCGDDPSF